MEILFGILAVYYLMVFILVGWAGSIVILSSGDVLGDDEILSNRQQGSKQTKISCSL